MISPFLEFCLVGKFCFYGLEIVSPDMLYIKRGPTSVPIDTDLLEKRINQIVLGLRLVRVPACREAPQECFGLGAHCLEPKLID